jgi:hypothetical protein
MPQNRSRFVLLCQQSLACAVVAAVAAPAASLVTLDIVAPPRQPRADAPVVPGVADATSAVVASRPVRPVVSTVPLTGVSKAGLRALRQDVGARATPRSRRGAARLVAADTTPAVDDLTVLSAPQPVDGLATVGVTWSNRVELPDRAIDVAVRTRTGDTWSGWTHVPYHEEEGPDPTSPEGRASTPGTQPVYVGKVDDVQVKATTDSGTAPEGMRLALVDPGAEAGRSVQQPAIDTGEAAAVSLSAAESADPEPADLEATDTPEGTDDGSLLAGSVTARPQIYSRAQWGADERMRDASSLHYGEVHSGFVHHTVNANSYTRAQVPAILRGIYAYHTQSRGWSDVGYNFLVDRFGRIWEGRYGGVARPVVGAHTLGYNDDAFAMSAIGNFDVARPPAAMVNAYGRLMAWKLSLHGVRATSTRQWVTKRYLPAINGHRDVGQTACPGKYLYAKIPTIRNLAAAAQRSWGGRPRRTNLAGSSAPDIVMRDHVSRRMFLIRSRGSRLGSVTNSGTIVKHANWMMNAGDWNGDRRGDVITRSGPTGLLYLYRGNGRGRFAPGVKMSRTSFRSVRLLSAVGDITGDGRPDLMGQPRGGSMRIYPGNGGTGLRRSYVAHSAVTGSQQLGVGLWNGDGSPDSVIRRGDGSLWLYPGNGPGGLTGGTRIGSVGRGYDMVVATGDLTGDGRTDLVVRASATKRLWLLRGTPTGFAPRHVFAAARLGRFDLAG